MADGPTAAYPTATAALEAVQHRPREAIAMARRVLAQSTSHGSTAAERSTARRAIGLALRELHDLPQARRELHQAVREAEQARSPRLAALARMSLGYVLASAGDNQRAWQTVTAALPWLAGAEAGRARMQRGVVAHYCGHYDDAVRDYTAAVAIAQHEGDPLLEARARNNRGLLHAHRGTTGGVDGDLPRAEALFQQLGLALAAADTRWNAGVAAAQQGQLPAALRTFAAVDREYRRMAVPRPALLLDRFELLLAVPLLDEATAVADQAVAELSTRRMASDLAEALLARARAALATGALDTAALTAARARTRFRRQGRPVWEAFARHIELRSAYHHGLRTASLLTAMVRTAALLDDAGWHGPATAIRIDAARVADALGRRKRARELLLTASAGRRRGPPARRIQAWYATALLRRGDGDAAGALRALRRGLAVLDEHRAALGASELRARSAAHGQELASEGLDMAIGSGAPSRVFGWAERCRTYAMRRNVVLPPADPRLAAALAELRMVSAGLEEAQLAGRRAQVLRRRQAALEREIRELDRQRDGGYQRVAPPSVRAVGAALGHAALVELVTHRDEVLAVVVRDGRATVRPICPISELVRQARLHRFTLRRLATLDDSGRTRDAATTAAAALDDLLFGPVRKLLADRPLVVVPAAELHALPWAGLPTCAGRPVTVAPSATAWYHASMRRVPDRPPVLVAGPDLPAADEEVRALAEMVPESRLLAGAHATASAVATALDGARLAHIAAHGRFRADSPEFSTLELADGPLAAYELARLGQAPGCVVLSACDSGLGAVHPGEELIGLAAGMLANGSRTIVGSVLPVPAARTTALMVALHRRMLAGAGPAEALAGAQQEMVAAGDALGLATAAAFVCLGTG